MFLFVLVVGGVTMSVLLIFFFLGARVNLPHPLGMEGCGILNEMARDSLNL